MSPTSKPSPNYKNTDEEQYQMMILAISQLYTEEHPTAQFCNLIQRLDLSKFHDSYKNTDGKGGASAFPPDRMIAVMMWHLLFGNHSKRQLEKDLTRLADLIYLSGGMEINHSSFSRFRKRHHDALERLFSQTVFLGAVTGLLDLIRFVLMAPRLKR